MKNRLPSRACSVLAAVWGLGALAGAAPPAHPLDLGSLTGANGLRLSGEAVDDRAGWSVGGAGDVNADGFDDVIVGVRTSFSEPGAAYVVFGKSSGLPANLDLSSFAAGDGSTGFKLTGAADDDQTGFSVAGAGDVNGDGFDDVVVGAPGFDPGVQFQAGAAYVLFGRTSFAGAGTIALSGLDGTSGFKILGAAEGDSAGTAVSAAGDVNGDGFDDIVVGAPGTGGPGVFRGSAHVVFGKSDFSATPTLAVAALSGANGFTLIGEGNGDHAGDAVRGAGDVNDDGFDDVVVGASLADAGGGDSGAAYVFLGKSTGFAATFALSGSMGAEGFCLLGDAGKRAGGSVAGADVNGDGFADVVVSEEANSDGRVNVMFGKASGLGNITLSALNGADGFGFLAATTNDSFGASVGRAGDVNGDGVDDLIVGAPFAGPPGVDRGAAYVLYGRTGAYTATISSAGLDGSNGFRIDGDAPGGTAGVAAAGAGDVDGDGVDDVVVGAPDAEPHGSRSGAAYVVFGGAGGGGGGLPVTIARNGRKATFTDVDGDLVSVSTNKGAFTQAHFTVVPAGTRSGGQFQRLRLAGTPGFAGATISVKAKAAAGGDGLVHVGAIDATGLDLGAVTVKGDVGRIAAGDPTSPKPAMKKLVVQSLGAFGLATQAAPGASLVSALEGDVKALTVKSDVARATVSVHGSVGKLAVGRDILGGGAESSGLIDVSGAVKSMRVKGSLRGGTGDYSGSIFVGGVIGSAVVGGSLVGDAGLESGTLETRAGAGKIAIGGSVQGGPTDSSGSVICLGPLKSLRVKGSVTGGDGEWSGSIYVSGANASIKSLRVDGSIVGGGPGQTGVTAGTTIGKLVVGKDVRGAGDRPVRIVAAGVPAPATAAAAITIGSVKVGGNVERALILAGWTADTVPVNPDVQIGKVTVTGDWTASTLAAGVNSLAGGFGDADDVAIAGGGLPAIHSRIAAVTIKGAVAGTAAADVTFGFVADEIGAFRVGTKKFVLAKGANNDDTTAIDPNFVLGADGDVRVREIAGN